jgi:putative membrane protein
MSMHRLMAKAAGGLVLTLGAGQMATLHAQGQGTDQQFVSQVGAANLLEVRLSQAAQQKGGNTSVKQFAQSMIVDHTDMQKQWIAVAKKDNIKFTTELNPQQLQQVQQLTKMSGADLDRAYMSMMVQSHRDNVDAFTRERSAPHSPDVRQLIESSLPRLQQHLSQAQQISSQVGVDVAVAGSAPTTTGGAATPNTTSGATPTPSTAPAQPGSTQPAATGPAHVKADSALIVDVDGSNSAELSLGRLAQQKAKDSQVKQFAQRMVSDHQAMQNEWRAVASQGGVTISGTVNPTFQQQVARLNQLSGAEFDRAFMSTMVQNHETAVNAFKSRGMRSNSTEVRTLVTKGLPTIQEHLRMARQLSEQVGEDSIATIAGQTGKNGKGHKGQTEAERKFIGENNAEDFLMIQLGQLAARKATDNSVKEFGRRMASEYTDMDKQWVAMETKNNLEVQHGMGPNHKAKLTKLEKLSGREFDREYISVVIKDLAGHLSYHKKEGRAQKLAPVRQLVEKRIPVMEKQLDQAKAIGNRIGADTTPTREDGEISVKQDK